MAQTNTPAGTPPAAPSAPATPTGGAPVAPAPAPAAPAVDPMKAVLDQLALMQKQMDAMKQDSETRIAALEAENAKLKKANEPAARKAGDDHLQAGLNQEAVTRAKEDSAVNRRVTDEEAARKKGDKDLNGRVDQEAKDRKAGDDAQGKRSDAIEANLNTESATRKTEDDKLNKRVDDETQARKDGDQKLQDGLTAEEAAREKGDKKLGKRIGKEEKAREEGDQKLQDGLDKETGEREAADIKHDERLADHEVRIRYQEGEEGMTQVFNKRFEDESKGIGMLARETGLVKDANDLSEIGFDTENKAYTLKHSDAKDIKTARDKLANAGSRASDADKQAYVDSVKKAIDGADVSTRVGADDISAVKGTISESKKGQKSVDTEAGGTGKSSQERALAIGEQLVKLGMDATKGNYAKLTGEHATHELKYASNKGLDALEKALDAASKDNLITPKELEGLSKMYNDRVLDPGIHKIPTDKAAAAANKANGPATP